MKTIMPHSYSPWEGGPWMKYSGPAVTLTELNRMRKSIRSVGYAVMQSDTCDITVHALAFDDPELGWGKFGRWDEINGWTTTRYNAERKKAA